ncbi:MAG: enoyl-CoA hydratase/isomerase family protein [Acidobacteriota bacterium]
MTAHYKDIQVAVTGRVARITFARPPLNILTIAMMKEIVDAINRVAETPDTCAIVFAASQASGAFCAGVSIEEHKPESVFQMLDGFHSIFRALNGVSKPVIALVGGAALGGGCELVAFADIVIASGAARFGQPEIKLGVFPPVAAFVLPRVIGDKKAREMILTGELLTADAAQSLGLVNHLVAENALEARCEELLGAFRQMSVPGLEMARRAMVQTWGLGFDEALKRSEDLYLNELMSFRDPQEGVEAFIAKRPPRWKHK